ncbi:hypothetical protein PMAYCL1PPCAC_26852, partial [Pristionchus mayeri]
QRKMSNPPCSTDFYRALTELFSFSFLPPPLDKIMFWIFSLAASACFILLTMRYFFKGARWTSKRSARGKTIIVTGANSGIGRALTEEFLMRGADHIVLACRSQERAGKARQEMIESGADESCISIELVDLMSFKSVIAFVDRVMTKYRTIDVLVCNAGVLQADGLSENGVEKLLQANYLGHFVMVESLRARLDLKRVVFVSSLVHKYAKQEDLTKRLDNNMLQYSRAKLAEVSYARHLANEGMQAYSCNPGVVHTNILAGTWMEIFDRYLEPVLSFIMKNPLEGAQTPLMLSLAAAEHLQPGYYYSDCAIDATHPLLKDNEKIEELHRQSIELAKEFL